jgi:hypothetical protein
MSSAEDIAYWMRHQDRERLARHDVPARDKQTVVVRKSRFEALAASDVELIEFGRALAILGIELTID